MKKSFPYLLCPEKRKLNSGTILFVAVGAIAVLSILTLSATSVVLQKLKMANAIESASTTFYLAESVPSLLEVFLAADASGGVTLYVLRDRQMRFGNKDVLLSFTDEEGLINVGRVPKDILRRLPGLFGDEELLDKIVASHLQVKEGLLLLDGMTQEKYDGLKDIVTTFGRGAVNINTAHSETLEVLGMDEALITAIQQYRAGDDGEEATEDDNVFQSADQIIPILEGIGLGASQKAVLVQLISASRLSTTSDHIRFEMSILKGKKKIRSYNIVVNLSQKIPVLWQEN